MLEYVCFTTAASAYLRTMQSCSILFVFRTILFMNSFGQINDDDDDDYSGHSTGQIITCNVRRQRLQSVSSNECL